MANYCSNCGNALHGAKFCPNCGHQAEAKTQTTGDAFMNQNRRTSDASNVLGAIIGIGLLSSLFRPRHCHHMHGMHFHGPFGGFHHHH